MTHTIAIVGFGSFGRFMAQFLVPYARVLAYDTGGVPATVDGVECAATPQSLSQAHCVIFAVPLSGLSSACEQVRDYVSEDALIVDVTSVKEAPLMVLRQHFPGHKRLGTHPIFGPVSGREGIAGMRIVVCNDSFDEALMAQTRKFLKEKLELQVIEMSARAHDEEIACVQGLTHFIGRALMTMGIPKSNIATKSYQHLHDLVALLAHDSFELFKTIENGNPYTKEVREAFMTTLKGLEDALVDSR